MSVGGVNRLRFIRFDVLMDHVKNREMLKIIYETLLESKFGGQLVILKVS